MQKVVYSISKVNKDEKLKGVGYLVEGNLLIPSTSQKGNAYIFFVRNVDSLDTPFVTVEYSLSKHKVLQCYGDHDSKPNDSVMEFVNKKWLPFANKQLKKIQAAA